MLPLIRCAVLVALVLAVAVPCAQAQEKYEVDQLVGKPAPDFHGDFAVNGKPTKLSELKGKVVVLDFWAVWCGPCIATFPHLKEWNKEYKDKGLEIVGVTMYNCEGARPRNFGFDKTTGKLTRADKQTKEGEQGLLKDFASHHKLDHLLMAVPADDWKKLGTDYKVPGYPTVFVIDRKGNVALAKVGSTEESAKAIEAKIKELLAEK